MRSALISLTTLAAVALMPSIASAGHRFGTDRGARYSGHGGHYRASHGHGYHGGHSKSSFGFSFGVAGPSHYWNFGYSKGYGYGGYCPPSSYTYCPPRYNYYAPPVVYAPPPVYCPPVYYSAPVRYYSAPCYVPRSTYYYGGARYYGR